MLRWKLSLFVLSLVLTVQIITIAQGSFLVPDADAYLARYGHINWHTTGTGGTTKSPTYNVNYGGYAAVQTESSDPVCTTSTILNLGSISPGEGGTISSSIKVTNVINVPGTTNKICYGLISDSAGNPITKTYSYGKIGRAHV